jgi:hypothetical protein
MGSKSLKESQAHFRRGRNFLLDQKEARGPEKSQKGDIRKNGASVYFAKHLSQAQSWVLGRKD